MHTLVRVRLRVRARVCVCVWFAKFCSGYTTCEDSECSGRPLLAKNYQINLSNKILFPSTISFLNAMKTYHF